MQMRLLIQRLYFVRPHLRRDGLFLQKACLLRRTCLFLQKSTLDLARMERDFPSSIQTVRKVPMAFGKLHLLVLLCLSIVITGCSARKKVEPMQVPSGMISDEMSNVAQIKPKQGAGPVKITSTGGKENEAFCTIAMVKPADGPVNSPYGVRRIPGKKRGKKFHKGIDIGAKRGSDVVAAAPGKVIFSGKKRGYGNTVEIAHDNGLVTLYAHMDKIFVSEGQPVAEAGRIGIVGRSGRTTGPNLHFELLAGGKPVNPVPTQGWKRDRMPARSGGWREIYPEAFVSGAELTAFASKAKTDAFGSRVKPDAFMNGAELAAFARGAKPDAVVRGAKAGALVSKAKLPVLVSEAKPDAVAGGEKSDIVVNKAKLTAFVSDAWPDAFVSGAKLAAFVNGAKPDAWRAAGTEGKIGT